MDLTQIENLNSRMDELNKKIEEKRKRQEKLRETLYKSEDEIRNLTKETKNLSSILHLLNGNNIEIYGVFDTKEIGKLIAKLATSITGIRYKFTIITEKGFSCIKNHGINYDKEIATLTNVSKKEAPYSWDLRFAVANDIIEDEEISFRCDGYGGYGSCSTRELGKFIKLTKYNEETKSFEFRKMYGKNTETFISDFLIFVSNYRLEHNLININENELNELLNIFITTYESNYTRYKKEQQELESSIRHHKEEEEAEERRRKEINQFKLSPYYYMNKKRIKRR